MAEAQLVHSLVNDDGSPTAIGDVLNNLNLFFTAAFTAELLLNLAVHWWMPFFSSGWNLLDMVVVALSLAALGPIDLPMTVLRMMRVFRVIRLFGRMRELKKMIIACMSSLIPMMNAFLIMVIIASICAPAHPHPHTRGGGGAGGGWWRGTLGWGFANRDECRVSSYFNHYDINDFFSFFV